MKGPLGDGKEVIVDDYREGYWWLRDNTAILLPVVCLDLQ
jgi:hypothetical protein